MILWHGDDDATQRRPGGVNGPLDNVAWLKSSAGIPANSAEKVKAPRRLVEGRPGAALVAEEFKRNTNSGEI